MRQIKSVILIDLCVQSGLYIVSPGLEMCPATADTMQLASDTHC